MNEDAIKERIKQLTLERKVLEDTHNFQVQENHQINQNFQQQIIRNQTRFAQISGAITELQQLIQGDQNAPINVNRSYAATYGNLDRVPGGVGSDSSHSGTDLGN